jgi:hypothetical protein
MGIVDLLKTSEGTFAMGAVAGYVGGDWAKKKLTAYLEDFSYKIVERVKESRSQNESTDTERIYKSLEERLTRIEERLVPVQTK